MHKLTRFVLSLCGTITVLAQSPASITKQPQGLSRSLGDSAVLSVFVAGDPPPTFQWKFQGAELSHATNRALTLTNLSRANAGDYTVVVSNPGATVTSLPATLDVDGLFTLMTASPVSRSSGWGPSWGDYDDDGLMDLYIAGNSVNLLYHNDGQGIFTRVGATNVLVSKNHNTDAAGAGYWADYDGDGKLDLFLPVGWGGALVPNQLFRGLGGGAFESVTTAPVGKDLTGGTSASWADFNRDGYLDLFVANLAQDDSSTLNTVNTLYLGQPGGQFVPWKPAAFSAFKARNYGCTVGDFNGDGYPDIALSLRQAPALRTTILFNLGGTDFEAVSIVNGGSGWGGVSAADFDNNGTLDLFSGWVDGSANRLLKNDGAGNFETVPDAGPSTEAARTQSAAWGDYDNDGYPDLFVARTGESAGNDRNDSLWHNNGDGTFTQVRAGSLSVDDLNSSGAAWGDADNDGFLDLVVAISFGGNSRLFHNNGNSNGWLMLKLVGTKSNRSAIGAKVRLTATLRGSKITQFREIGTGTCFGQNDPRAHFGLADAAQADTIEIEWPSGKKQTLNNIPARQILTVTEPDDSIRLQIQVNRGHGVGAMLRLDAIGPDGTLVVFEKSPDFQHWTEYARQVIGTDLAGSAFVFPIADSTSSFFRARLP